MIEDNGSYAQNQRNDSHIWNNLTRIKMGLNIYMGFYIQKLLKIFNTYWLMLPVSTCVVSSQNMHNNNGVCVATANQILAAVGTQAGPEMALQVGAAGQPTGSENGEIWGHVTNEEPIGAGAPGPDQNQGNSSHIGQDHHKPMDSQGCSAGL